MPSTIKKMSVKGFRGFATKQIFNFSQPTGEPGSGLNIILGPNNSGKSSVVEALVAITQSEAPSFSEGKRNKTAGDRIEITLTNVDGDGKTVSTIPAGGSQTNHPDYAIPPVQGEAFAIYSRRNLPTFFGKSSTNRERYAQNYQKLQNQREVMGGLPGRIFHLYEDEDRLMKFNALLERILIIKPDWTIEQSDHGDFYLKFKSGNNFHSSEGIGEGLLSLFYIVDALYDATPNSVIIIDEPELSLHPQFQRRLRQVFSEYSSDRQIILTTHSPIFIDWNAIANGAGVIRTVKQKSRISANHLQQKTRERIAGLISNRNNPHILGLDASEVFFLEDNVILLEGQEDVLLYPRVFEKLGITPQGEFFGWGAGGADNMTIICSILNDLGFKKVAGIIDGNRKENVGRLQKDFPKYSFFALPADDIRSKKAIVAKPAVKGLLDSDGNIRNEYEEDTQKVLIDVGKYMQKK